MWFTVTNSCDYFLVYCLNLIVYLFEVIHYSSIFVKIIYDTASHVNHIFITFYIEHSHDSGNKFELQIAQQTIFRAIEKCINFSLNAIKDF